SPAGMSVAVVGTVAVGEGTRVETDVSAAGPRVCHPGGVTGNSQGWSEPQASATPGTGGEEEGRSPNGATRHATGSPLRGYRGVVAGRTRGSAALHPWLLPGAPLVRQMRRAAGNAPRPI